MSNSGIDDFERADDLTLLDGMDSAAQLGLPVAVHAESDAITAGLAARARAEGRTGVRDYLDSRPVVAEVEAIRRVDLVCRGDRVRAPHRPCEQRRGRGGGGRGAGARRGRDVRDVPALPRLHRRRRRADRRARQVRPAASAARRSATPSGPPWRTGGSRSSPPTIRPRRPSLKTSADFFAVWGGIAGVQSTLPILLVEGHAARAVPLDRIAALTAGAPARRFGLAGKGTLAPGFDADLAVVDLRAATPLRRDDLHDRHRASPYVGRPLHGLVRHTFVRGVAVVQEGQPTGARPGRLVRPASGRGPATSRYQGAIGTLRPCSPFSTPSRRSSATARPASP